MKAFYNFLHKDPDQNFFNQLKCVTFELTIHTMCFSSQIFNAPPQNRYTDLLNREIVKSTKPQHCDWQPVSTRYDLGSTHFFLNSPSTSKNIFESGLVDPLDIYVCVCVYRYLYFYIFLFLLFIFICPPNLHGNSVSSRHQNIFWSKVQLLINSPRFPLERKI